MKVENMTSNNGNKVANQFIVTAEKGRYYQSYRSIIVFIPFFTGCIAGDRTQLDRNKWDYSKTTGKYRNQFLGETKAETQKKIDSGEYILTDLN